jgi:hypothetical protein
VSDNQTRCQRKTAQILLTSLGLGVVLAIPASAIECVRGFQRVQGNLIATPYCQDDLLAHVASEYGMHAGAANIRNNPNYKKEVCLLVGQDIRVQEHCQEVLPQGRGVR